MFFFYIIQLISSKFIILDNFFSHFIIIYQTIFESILLDAHNFLINKNRDENISVAFLLHKFLFFYMFFIKCYGIVNVATSIYRCFTNQIHLWMYKCNNKFIKHRKILNQIEIRTRHVCIMLIYMSMCVCVMRDIHKTNRTFYMESSKWLCECARVCCVFFIHVCDSQL